jgi:hypothetical protein
LHKGCNSKLLASLIYATGSELEHIFIYKTNLMQLNAQFPVLSDPAYVTYIGSLTFKGGTNQSTHIAEIRYPVQNAPVLSVVKLLPPDGLAACNEALAWLFLRAAGIPSPRTASLLTLTEKKIVAILGRKHVPQNLVSNGYVRAWAAEQLDFKSIQAHFAGSKSEVCWLKLLQTTQGAAIAAFDEAFFNTDRNTGNILFSGDERCIPIDHEHCFGQQNWQTEELQQSSLNGDSIRLLKNGVQTGKIRDTELQHTYGNIVFHAEKHAASLQACKGHMTELLCRVYPGNGNLLAQRVLSFVTERTTQLWMNDRLGVC